MRRAVNPRGSVKERPSDIHPTKEKLLKAVDQLLETQPLESITVEQLLKSCGVSKGSLYHHFTDFPALLEMSLVRSFATSVNQSIAVISKVVAQSSSKEDFFRSLVKVTVKTQAVEQRATRFKRARIIVMAERNAQLSQVLAVEQQRLTTALMEQIAQAQKNGWVNKEIDPQAGAVLIQAYTLGKIVDDLSQTPMSPENWNQLITRLAERVFG